MSRSSPGVRRVAAILNFIADHPGQAFALTDLVRALKLSRATCHALLTGLVDVGYLYRTGDKTYVLGPALAAIGRTAADHFSPLQVAQPEMRALADEFDVVCGAYFLEGDVIHLRDRAASLSHVGYPVPLGTRMPLRSVQAIAFYARAPREADAWLDRTDPRPSPEQVDLMTRGMEFVREHGFIALVRRPGAAQVDPGATSLLDARTDELPVIPLLELRPDQAYSLMAIMAPIYDARDKVTIALVMAGFHLSQSAGQVERAGQRLREACERISRFLSGNLGDD
ncbi:IclR family transcriptional regulator [Novosphingobium album (ex Liu et al. 2023)]|uniref:Helix-turn-helix domain-containing protein n=1 Tax=Novosphingobium album (ex Liu et al. 2023) TaxID=3031130 RepID=A0ABT5WX26_9SPHN|nr:helix-turn-helix domain-containing protein [Novosphingobium album (ex Liu et al. 2023)]MDE8654404.1 helix-turn-helix domain-containing protein [Novosphingobium album (ex Liu et al. 2023)]